MHIQSYQIHNVLNVYRRQISQGKTSSSRNREALLGKADSVTLSREGKNQSIMEKVTASVIEKITNVASEVEPEKASRQTVDRPYGNLSDPEREHSFTFNAIVGENQKETRSISIGNSQGLMNRLNELAQAAVNEKPE